jgi:general secretion pathway protein M
MNPLLRSLSAAWRERSVRERRVLAGGGGVLALVLVLLVAVEPAVQGLARLDRTLPQARAQERELSGLLAEIRDLRKLPPASAGADPRGAVERALAAAALAPARTKALDNGDLQYAFTGVNWAHWLQWLVGAEHDLGVRAVVVHVTATSTPGSADVELTLRLPR